MRKAPDNIAEHKKSRTESFASIARSFGEANNRYQTLAAESFGRAVEIQSQFVGEAYESYIAQMSKIGRMFFIPLPQVRTAANLNTGKTADSHRASAKPKVNSKPRRRAAAAQSMTASRKTGTVARQMSKRPSKTKRRHKG
jgi:hypothetical protein